MLYFDLAKLSTHYQFISEIGERELFRVVSGVFWEQGRGSCGEI